MTYTPSNTARDIGLPDHFLHPYGRIIIPTDAVLKALDEIGCPVSMKALGAHLGLLADCPHRWCDSKDSEGNCFDLSHRYFKRGPTNWADAALKTAVLKLRNFGLVVKLPHDGVGGKGVTYTTCKDYEHGVQLQAEACLSILDEVPEHMHRELRYRRLRTALDGLLSVAEPTAGGEP